MKKLISLATVIAETFDIVSIYNYWFGPATSGYIFTTHKD